MSASFPLAPCAKANGIAVGRVVYFTPSDRLYQFDLTIGNKELDAATIADTGKFSAWINEKLADNNCLFGFGGYMENRNIYAHSPLFNSGDVQRRHHLGVDIWAKAGTAICSPLNGKVHSFKDNNSFGDYGPTIIL